MQIQYNTRKPQMVLSSSPQTIAKFQLQIYLALKNHSIINLNPYKMQIQDQWNTQHEKRISSINKNGNMLITASYDSTVKLWDCRDRSMIHAFKKPGAQFTSIDCSGNILAAGHSSKIIFWDVRKMKQRCQFTQSFNGQISCLKFDKENSHSLMACSRDGMINKFDLTQSNQEQAFQWGHRIQQCPQHLIFKNDYTVVKTTDHTILTLYKQDVINKQQFNNPQTPKHILQYNFTKDASVPCIDVFLWNLNDHCIQGYSNLHQIGYINEVQDIQVMCWIQETKVVLWGDEKGNLFIDKLGSKMKNKSKNQNNMIIQEDYSVKNGFIVNKPSSLKNNHKKFKPY